MYGRLCEGWTGWVQMDECFTDGLNSGVVWFGEVTSGAGSMVNLVINQLSILCVPYYGRCQVCGLDHMRALAG